MGQESSSEVLEARTVEAVAKFIKDGKAKRIVVMTGAGISTSAGIPDFRSPDTGLYANLARLNLPYPEAVFDIKFFRNNPHPFYALAHELYPGKFRPTVAHSFVRLLSDKGLLFKLYTQNIDCLEREAGVPGDKIIEAHGSFATQRCIACKTPFPDDLMKKTVSSGDVPYCITPQCNGLVKPDIVFFGEPLPEEFLMNRYLPARADLCIIMGTSLSVHPFASLPSTISESVPRLLINKEIVGGLGSRPDDVILLGDCDEGVRRLAKALGWLDELEALWETTKALGYKDPKPEKERTRDEVLEDEVTKLTAEVEQTLRISNDHNAWLKKHLEQKHLKGDDSRKPPEPAADKTTNLDPSQSWSTVSSSDPSQSQPTPHMKVPQSQANEESSPQNNEKGTVHAEKNDSEPIAGEARNLSPREPEQDLPPTSTKPSL